MIVVASAWMYLLITAPGCSGKKGAAEARAPEAAPAAEPEQAAAAEGQAEPAAAAEPEPGGGEGQGEQAEGSAEAQPEPASQPKPEKKVDVDTQDWGDLFMARKFTTKKDLGPLAGQMPGGFSFNKRMLVAAKDPSWWLNPANTKPLKLKVIEVSQGGPVDTDLPPEKISEEPTYSIKKKKMVINLVSVTINNPEGCGKKAAAKKGAEGGASAETGKGAPGAVVVELYAVPAFKGLVEINRTAITKTCPGPGK